MVIRDTMFDKLLAACPSFLPAWEQFVAEWAGEQGELPHYVALGALARHVVALVEASDEAALRPIFVVVEEWHTEGDDYVREAATIGFLETLGNHLDYAGIDARRIQAMLGAESRRWWDKLDRFWSGDAGALSDPRPSPP